MRGEEAVRLVRRRRGEAVDIVMGVALDMGDAEERGQVRFRLYGDTGLARQVLGGDEGGNAVAAPALRAHAIEQGLVEALAGFRRHAAIAEPPRPREVVVLRIRLVDDDGKALAQR